MNSKLGSGEREELGWGVRGRQFTDLFEEVTWVQREPVMARSGGVGAQVEGMASVGSPRCDKLSEGPKAGWTIMSKDGQWRSHGR